MSLRKGQDCYPMQSLIEGVVVWVDGDHGYAETRIGGMPRRLFFRQAGHCGFIHFEGEILLKRSLSSTRALPGSQEKIFAVIKPSGSEFVAVWWGSGADVQTCLNLSRHLITLEQKSLYVPEDFFSGRVSAMYPERGFGFIESDDTNYGLKDIFFGLSNTAKILYVKGGLFSRWYTRLDDPRKIPRINQHDRIVYLIREKPKGLEAYSVCPEEVFLEALREYDLCNS